MDKGKEKVDNYAQFYKAYNKKLTNKTKKQNIEAALAKVSQYAASVGKEPEEQRP